MKREEFVLKNSKVKSSPSKLPRMKSREDSLAGSSRAHSTNDDSFDFGDDKFDDNESKKWILYFNLFSN